MNDKMKSTDPEAAATLRALRRAAKRAMRVSQATGTPFWVMKNGRVVNLNPKGRRKSGRRQAGRARECEG